MGLAPMAHRIMGGENLGYLRMQLEARVAKEPSDAAAWLDLGTLLELSFYKAEGARLSGPRPRAEQGVPGARPRGGPRHCVSSCSWGPGTSWPMSPGPVSPGGFGCGPAPCSSSSLANPFQNCPPMISPWWALVNPMPIDRC